VEVLPRRLLDELSELHPRQRAAALHDGDVVVRAGPGSGKTRTLVARVGVMLSARVSPFRGAACITYTNAAADEVRRRVQRLGVPADRLVCSTVHSFCLNEILRNFAALSGQVPPAAGGVLDQAAGVSLLQECFDQLGIPDVAKWRESQVTKIRRLLACGEDVTGMDDREIRAAQLYERTLSERGQSDFEDMVIRALTIVRQSAPVRDLIRARFRHLIVDEYQDLGGVVHNLVLALREVGVAVTAVGDADQTVFGFAGADPKYLEELSLLPGVRPFDLEVNYRSGQKLIAASEAALGHSRGRRATEGKPAGTVNLVRVEGDLDQHALVAVEALQAALGSGVPHERIAVLYPSRGAVLDVLLARLHEDETPFIHERDEDLPRGRLARFVQRCASRRVLQGQLRNASLTPLQVSSLLRRSEAPSLKDLADEWQRLRREAGLPPAHSRLELLRRLQRTLDPTPLPADQSATAWLGHLMSEVDLLEVAESHPESENRRGFEKLQGLAKDLKLQELASGVEVAGKVVLTTYHSAKGREFRVVILPGLVAGIVPRDVKKSGGWQPASGRELQEQRRAFYVAVSRAEDELHLITGPGYFAGGYWWGKGPSPFLADIVDPGS
jgi:DNA helicase-2/ATP-dependent DNA helicase PcrA